MIGRQKVEKPSPYLVGRRRILPVIGSPVLTYDQQQRKKKARSRIDQEVAPPFLLPRITHGGAGGSSPTSPIVSPPKFLSPISVSRPKSKVLRKTRGEYPSPLQSIMRQRAAPIAPTSPKDDDKELSIASEDAQNMAGSYHRRRQIRQSGQRHEVAVDPNQLNNNLLLAPTLQIDTHLQHDKWHDKEIAKQQQIDHFKSERFFKKKPAWKRQPPKRGRIITY